jgi:hypothetical protein
VESEPLSLEAAPHYLASFGEAATSGTAITVRQSCRSIEKDSSILLDLGDGRVY